MTTNDTMEEPLVRTTTESFKFLDFIPIKARPKKRTRISSPCNRDFYGYRQLPLCEQQVTTDDSEEQSHVELAYGLLYAPRAGILSTETMTADSEDSCSDLDSCNDEATHLGIAYAALEAMRKQNLELICHQRGMTTQKHDFQHECLACLLSAPSSSTQRQDQDRTTSRLAKLQGALRHQLGKRFRPSKMSSCLVCASSTCSQHASAIFSKENIVVCLDCEKVFTLDVCLEFWMAESLPERQALLHRLLDVYDRTLLLLKYSTLFVDEVATHLETAKQTQNKIHVGSSSFGFLSGALGFAAAATFLTSAPIVGPPLLMASLLLGGSATAVQTGTDLRHSVSEPNRLANRILALHGMLQSIVRVTRALRDSVLEDKRMERGEDDDSISEESSSSLCHERVISKNSIENLAASVTAGRCSVAATESTVFAGRSARFFSKTGASALSTAHFVGFADGALSIATLLLEAGCLMRTMESIRKGSPCEKAELLRNLTEDLDYFPQTSDLQDEIHDCLAEITKRERVMTEKEVTQILLDLNREDSLGDYCFPDIDEESEHFVSDNYDSESSVTDDGDGDLSESTCDEEALTSLLERIETYKAQRRTSISTIQTTVSTSSATSTDVSLKMNRRPSLSLLERISLYKRQESSSQSITCSLTDTEDF